MSEDDAHPLRSTRCLPACARHRRHRHGQLVRGRARCGGDWLRRRRSRRRVGRALYATGCDDAGADCGAAALRPNEWAALFERTCDRHETPTLPRRRRTGVRGGDRVSGARAAVHAVGGAERAAGAAGRQLAVYVALLVDRERLVHTSLGNFVGGDAAREPRRSSPTAARRTRARARDFDACKYSGVEGRQPRRPAAAALVVCPHKLVAAVHVANTLLCAAVASSSPARRSSQSRAASSPSSSSVRHLRRARPRLPQRVDRRGLRRQRGDVRRVHLGRAHRRRVRRDARQTAINRQTCKCWWRPTAPALRPVQRRHRRCQRRAEEDGQLGGGRAWHRTASGMLDYADASRLKLAA